MPDKGTQLYDESAERQRRVVNPLVRRAQGERRQYAQEQ